MDGRRTLQRRIDACRAPYVCKLCSLTRWRWPSICAWHGPPRRRPGIGPAPGWQRKARPWPTWARAASKRAPSHTTQLRADRRRRCIAARQGGSGCRCGRSEPSPGADVEGVRPVPVQCGQGRAHLARSPEVGGSAVGCLQAAAQRAPCSQQQQTETTQAPAPLQAAVSH